MIEVTKQDEHTYDVAVSGSQTTRHQVTLTSEYHKKLTGGRVPPEKLLEASFEFLLEREPNTSILSQFDLPLIGRYFPEYENEIQRRIGTDE